MSTLKIVLLSVASSLVWALFVRELVGESLGERAIRGGIFAAPVIGIVMGLTIGRMRPGSTLARAAVSLLGLYAAAILFGLAVGIADVATGVNVAPNARRIPSAVIFQSMFGVVWGLTFMGYVVWLWPLAYVNFWLLWRVGAPSSRVGAT